MTTFTISRWWLMLFVGCRFEAAECFSHRGFSSTFRLPLRTLPSVSVKSLSNAGRPKLDRHRNDSPAVASKSSTFDNEIILTMYNQRYNLTTWADHHPGGIAVLQKYHNRNATVAYEKIGHSHQALALLERFRIVDDEPDMQADVLDKARQNIASGGIAVGVAPSWRSSTLAKLVTKEDPYHFHKLLGVFCLLHFMYRYALVFSGWDRTAGFGTVAAAAHGAGSSRSHLRTTVGFLIPHALLSSSSLIFHTVPKERVRGKPMIWKEYRWHNMIFGFRSILACIMATLMMTIQNIPSQQQSNVLLARATSPRFSTKQAITLASSVVCLASHVMADVATAKLRTNTTETTVTTVPFWDGCSPATHNQLRTFYGYSQFLATLTCLIVCSYPSWPFLILFPIQFASLLMTLCRKGIITSRQFHTGYTAALLMSLFVAIQNAVVDSSAVSELAAIVGGAAVLYGLRRRYHVNKYLLWIPTAVVRVAIMGRQVGSY